MKYRIGEFSRMAKVGIKTLRYYDEVGLLKPSFTDRFNGYRYYTEDQMQTICTIRECRAVGMSIEDIRDLLASDDPVSVLETRRSELEDSVLRIDKLIQEMRRMSRYSAEMKELPGCIVASMHGVIEEYSKLTEFVMDFAGRCARTNPDVTCDGMDYCFVRYTGEGYQERDVELTYYQAVDSKGTDAEGVEFSELQPVKAVCVSHVGPYSALGDAYAFIARYISENGLKVTEPPRECYIHGCWDRESPDGYLTEIQIPIERFPDRP